MADTMVKDIVYLGPKTWRNAAGTDLEASSLPANFHGARRYMPIPVGGEWIVISITQLWSLLATITAILAVCPLLQQHHKCLGRGKKLYLRMAIKDGTHI